MSFNTRSITISLAALLTLGGCYALSGADGGGEADFDPPRPIDARDIAVHPGYRIEPVVTGLTFPTGAAFDDQGRLYILEAGYSYGEVITTPRLLRLESDGTLTEIAAGENPPWNGVTFHDGAFYVAGGTLEGGQVLRITPDGQMSTILDGLPSMGDHHTNGPVFGPDGMLYIAQGTATNSGVVGVDNYEFGWLTRHPDFHDIPCHDITLTGTNIRTRNPLTEDDDDEVETGAFVPFGTPTQAGQAVPGEIPCSGAVFRIAPEGGEPELVAWGFRNPFGLAWSPRGELFVTENQFDVRGSRPVWGAGDLLWRVEPGTWYGWPDFWGPVPLAVRGRFKAPGERAPGFLLQDHPNDPQDPAAMLAAHSSSSGLDFSTNPEFGFVGQAFIAQFGDMISETGKTLAPVGFKVIRVDVDTGEIWDFAINRGKENGPASLLESGGLERPVAVRFDPAGEALYVIDFGVMTIRRGRIIPYPKTGIVWRIVPDASSR